MQITQASYAKNNNPKNLPVYNGIPTVKAANVKEGYAQWELEEYQKCKASPEYFIEKYIILEGEGGSENFKLYDYQKDAIQDIKENRYTIILAPRRAGKSFCILGYLCWFAIFHTSKNVYVLSKTHDDSKFLLSKLKAMYQTLPFFLQPGVDNYAVERVELSNGTKLITAPSTGVRGDHADVLLCVSGDTFVTIKNDDNSIENIKISEVEKKYDNKKYHIIYKSTNLINNKIYIGYHSTNILEDGYIGSGTQFKEAVKKYGRKNFKREILFIFDNIEDALKKEREIVNEEFIKRDDNYNLVVGGLLGGEYRVVPHGERKKIINKCKGIVYPNLTAAKKAMNTNYIVRECGNPDSCVEFEDPKEQKKAIEMYKNFLKNKEILRESCSNRFKGKKLPPEQIEKSRQGNLGKKCLNLHNKDPEKIRKMAEKHRGMKRSEEAKKRMSEAKKGCISKTRKLSEENIIKIREDYKNNIEVNLISEFGKPLVYKSAFCMHYAKILGVSVPCIRNIIDNTTYKEVK